MRMTKFNFIREVRTQFSEIWGIYIDNNENCIGRADIHIDESKSTYLYITLFESHDDDDIKVLVSALDDQIINTANHEDGNLMIDVSIAKEYKTLSMEN